MSRWSEYGPAPTLPVMVEGRSFHSRDRSEKLEERLRMARARLHEQERWLAAAADAVHLGVWVLDLDGDELHGSAQWLGLLGLPAGRALRLDDVVQRLDPQDREIFQRTLDGARDDAGHYAIECRLVQPGGDNLWTEWRWHTESGDDGQPLRVRGVTVDVSQRKREQIELMQRQQELTLLSRVAMLGGLSGAIAHELNQPLTAILSNANAAQRLLDRDALSPTDMHEILGDIATEGRRAGEIIHRLRMLMRPGEQPRLPLDVNTVVQETLQLLAGELESRQVTLQTDLAWALPQVRADRVQLQQVLINLVVNACDAMQDEPASRRRLCVRTMPAPKEGVQISVADQGSGVPDHLLDKVFDSFFTTKANGMGLGLSVCRSIVQAHDGRLWAVNNPGDGATFHFTLPGIERNAS